MADFSTILVLLCIAVSSMAHSSNKYREDNPRTWMQNNKAAFYKNLYTSLEGSTRDDVNYRLPTNAIPTSYFVRLLPFVNGNYSIFGYEEIRFDIVESTSSITIQIRDITIEESSIQLTLQDDSTLIPITGVSFDNITEFYVISVGSPLELGSYQLSLDYEAYLNNLLAGFYRSTYEDEDGNTITLGTTQFQSTDARRAFPCLDEPALKATFEIEMGREESMGAISNMPLVSTTPIDGMDGWVWDLYEVSVPMSTYLVAFIVSDFVSMSDTSDNGVLFRVWSRESAIDQANYALEIGPVVLTDLEDYFDIPFPLPKQDMAALPDFDAGAMENWGLITYRETAMLYDPLLSSASNKQRVTQVVAHELAHMWFGDLVTLDWWNDLWLNEGFASYVEYIGQDMVEPNYLIMEQYVVRDLQSIFQTDALESTHSLRVEVENPSEISEIFDGITYSKGSAVIRMMNFFLSEDVFRAGLTDYLNAFSYSTATQFDLWEYLDAQAQANGVMPDGQNVNDTMNTWTLQPGFPVINVQRMSAGVVEVSQKRFLLAETNTSMNYQWYIPLTYTTSIQPDFTQTFPQAWMTDEDTEYRLTNVNADADWVIFNIQQVSFYRVNYEVENWAALSSQLADDHLVIDVRNRAQLLDDSLNLARAGQLQYDVPFELANYLVNEQAYVPFDAALTGFNYIEEMFTRTGGYQLFKNYLLSPVSTVYNFVGYDDDLSGDHTTQLLRSLAVSWACALEYEPCLTNATADYAGWMAEPDNFASVSPNLKSAVYCTAVAEGGEEEWDFAWDRYSNSNLASEQSFLLYAMGCSNDLSTLSNYLDLAFTEDSGIRSQDSYQAFGSVASNDIGRDLAWDYLLNNYVKITEFYGSSASLQSMASTASSEFNTQSQLLELQAFKQVVVGLDPTAATTTIDQAIEEVQLNIMWMDNNYDYIVAWLEANSS